MIKIYEDTPDNISEIEPYVIMDSKQIGGEIIASEKCYFYDACSFRKHMLIPYPEYLFAYIKQTSGLVIITRCILMELCSNDNKLWKEHIDYIRKMYNASIRVLVIFEEDIYEAETICFSSGSEIGKQLRVAIQATKSKVGTVEETLKLDSALRDSIFVNSCTNAKKIYADFFKKARSKKESEDNLGEELIIICIHVLSNILEINSEFKYILFTEDKGAISQLGKAIDNIDKYSNKKTATAITTPKLVQILFERNIITEKEKLKVVLLAGNTDSNVKIFGCEKFDMNSTFKTMNCNELIEKITTPGCIHINF